MSGSACFVYEFTFLVCGCVCVLFVSAFFVRTFPVCGNFRVCMRVFIPAFRTHVCVIALSMCAVVYVRMSMSAFLVCIHLSCSRVSPICFYVSDHFSFRVYFACVYCYLLSTSFVFK